MPRRREAGRQDAFSRWVGAGRRTLPGWLRVFAGHPPVTRTANAVRSLILGQGALPASQTVAGEVTAAVLWSLAILVLAAPLAVRLYRRAVS